MASSRGTMVGTAESMVVYAALERRLSASAGTVMTVPSGMVMIYPVSVGPEDDAAEVRVATQAERDPLLCCPQVMFSLGPPDEWPPWPQPGRPWWKGAAPFPEADADSIPKVLQWWWGIQQEIVKDSDSPVSRLVY